MGDLDAPRPQFQRHLDHVRHAVEILAMHHHVERERQAGGAHRVGEARLAGMRAFEPGDAVAGVGREVLEAQLDVLQPGCGEGLDLARTAQRAGGDEIAVEAKPVRGADQRHQVTPRHRLAAGEMHLQHAECGRLGEHATPVVLANSPAARSRFTGLEQ